MTGAAPTFRAGTARSRRLNDIQWLRAIAAIEVAFVHSDLLVKSFSRYTIHSFGWYEWFGGIGVEIFFMVSGYVICLRAPSYPTGAAFLKARILRIYPLYWLFTTLVILIYFSNTRWHLGGFTLDLGSVVRSYLVLPQSDYPILPLGWTLEHEIIFYSAVALSMLVPAVHWPAMRRLLPLILALLALIGMDIGSEAGGRGTVGRLNGWDFHLLSPYMFAFAFGWLLRRIEEEGGPRPNQIDIAMFVGFSAVRRRAPTPRLNIWSIG